MFILLLTLVIAKNQDPSSHITDFHSPQCELRPLEKDYFEKNFDASSFEDIGVELTSELSWREAMLKVQQITNTGELKHLKFHPLQSFSYVPEAVAQGKKVVVLLLHVDGLQTGHNYTQNRGVVTVGYQLVNVKNGVKRHHFYVRIGIIPKSIYWTNDHIFQIVRKDLLALRRGIPVSVRKTPDRFEFIYTVLAGVIGDGPELSRFLNKTGLRGYAGHHVCFDNLEESKSSLGSTTENVFIPRRWIKNWVSVLWFHVYVFVCLHVSVQNVTQLRQLLEHLNKLDNITKTTIAVFKRLNGGWFVSNDFVNDCQITNDNTFDMDLTIKAMMHNDTKFSPLFGVIRCTDHLKQNLIKLYNSHVKKIFPKWFQEASQVYYVLMFESIILSFCYGFKFTVVKMMNYPTMSQLFTDHISRITKVFTKSGATKDTCQTFMYLYCYYFNFIRKPYLRSGIFSLGFYHSLLIGKFYDYTHVEHLETKDAIEEARVARHLKYLNLFIKHFNLFINHRMSGISIFHV